MTQKKGSSSKQNEFTMIADKENAEEFSSSASEEKVSVASNWKLVWWRYRKNRLGSYQFAPFIFVLTIIIFP